MWKKIIKKLLFKTGYDVVRYDYRNHPLARRMKLISSYGIDLTFDIGANKGQYAKQMRDVGYKGRIVSFEPLTSAYNELVRRAKNDPLWDTVNIALGDDDGEAEINIAGNSDSSSILDMLPAHVKAAPASAYIGKEGITVCRIDSIIGEYYHTGDRLYLKIDTQGYEKNVIEGAKNSLDSVIGIQLEMSLVPLYEGELLLADMINSLSQKGYTLVVYNILCKF